MNSFRLLQHLVFFFVFSSQVLIQIRKTKPMKNSILKSILSIILISITTLAFSQKKETRDVADFNSVGLSIHAELYITQGSPAKVVIEASEDELEDIETVVNNGHLNIKCKLRNPKFKNVKVWVTTPDITGLHMSGSGLILAESPINSGDLEIRLSGSGKVKVMELKGEEIKTSISGSGRISLGGVAEELDVSISGSGGLGASALQVEECDVRISGSGSCKVDATGELNASISGSGSVTYYSNPQVDAAVSGSGRVRKGEK